jgi:hypothetical protein
MCYSLLLEHSTPVSSPAAPGLIASARRAARRGGAVERRPARRGGVVARRVWRVERRGDNGRRIDLRGGEGRRRGELGERRGGAAAADADGRHGGGAARR